MLETSPTPGADEGLGEQIRAARHGSPDVLAGLLEKCRPYLLRVANEELAADLRAWLRGEPIAARLPGPLARLNAWSLRRERVRDAGLLAVTVNAVNCCYIVLWIVFFLFGIGARPRDVQAGIAESLLTAVLINAPQVRVGLRALAARGRALWAGLGMSVITLATLVSIVLVPASDLGGVHRDFAERWKLFLLFIILVWAQTLAYGLALRAFYHLRRKEGAPAAENSTSAL